MVYFFHPYKFNRIFLCGVLTTFSVAVLTPPPAYAQINIGLNDVAFAVRMEKLVEKLWKYKEKQDSNKLLDTMLDVKLETEGYTGTAINLDKEIDKAEAEIKRKGGKVPKKDLEKVRKAIKNKAKKSNQRAMCMASYLEDAPSMNFQEYEFLYKAAHGHDKEKEEEQDIKELPMRLTIGITMILAGGFLCIVGTRIPVCMEYGKQVAAAGVTFAIEGYVNRQDEDKNKDKDKNKR
jgi:hypothetical protein